MMLVFALGDQDSCCCMWEVNVHLGDWDFIHLQSCHVTAGTSTCNVARAVLCSRLGSCRISKAVIICREALRHNASTDVDLTISGHNTVVT